MLKLFVNKVNFQPQFIVNLLLVSNFESFLPSVYTFGMLYTLVYRCFRICSDWKKFHAELTFLKKIFCKNDYPENLFLNVKPSFPILSNLKILYPKILYLEFINFSVASAVSPIMARVSET